MRKVKTIGQYSIQKLIGRGSFAKVYLGVDTKTKKKVAIKMMKKKHITSKVGSLRRVRREVAIQKLLKHPNIISLHEVYETNNTIYMILDYVCRGDLFDYILGRGMVPRDQCLKFFQQIVYAIEYCSELSISHRDMKPENILLDENLNVKISDFGMARIMESTLLETSCGSPHYAAPEVLLGKKYDGNISVVWSIGVILYTMLTGSLPFDGETFPELVKAATRGITTFPKSLNKIERRIIRKMLCVSPRDRITISEIKKSKYFRQNFPDGYEPPKPPLIFSLEEPIPIETVSPAHLEYLSALDSGEATEKSRLRVVRKLSEDGPNLVKAFYILYAKGSSEFRQSKRLKKKVRSSLPLIIQRRKKTGGGGRRRIQRKRSSSSSSNRYIYSKQPQPSLLRKGSNDGVDFSNPTSDNMESEDGFSQSFSEVGDEWFESPHSPKSSDLKQTITYNTQDNSDADEEDDNIGLYNIDDIDEVFRDAEVLYDRVVVKSLLPLLEIATNIQKILRRSVHVVDWFYPNYRTFFVRAVDRKIPEDGGAIRIKIKIENSPSEPGENPVVKYSRWRPKDNNIIIHHSQVMDYETYLEEIRRKGNSSSRLLESANNPEYLNTVKFVWIDGSGESFCRVVATFLRELEI